MARNLKLLLGALAVLLVGAGTVFAESIVIKGSTTVLPVAQATTACSRPSGRVTATWLVNAALTLVSTAVPSEPQLEENDR